MHRGVARHRRLRRRILFHELFAGPACKYPEDRPIIYPGHTSGRELAHQHLESSHGAGSLLEYERYRRGSGESRSDGGRPLAWLRRSAGIPMRAARVSGGYGQADPRRMYEHGGTAADPASGGSARGAIAEKSPILALRAQGGTARPYATLTPALSPLKPHRLAPERRCQLRSNPSRRGLPGYARRTPAGAAGFPAKFSRSAGPARAA